MEIYNKWQVGRISGSFRWRAKGIPCPPQRAAPGPHLGRSPAKLPSCGGVSRNPSSRGRCGPIARFPVDKPVLFAYYNRKGVILPL